MPSRSPHRAEHEDLLRRLADALAKVAQEHGEDVDSDYLLSPPTEEADDDLGELVDDDERQH
jgi:hypothetical protein